MTRRLSPSILSPLKLENNVEIIMSDSGTVEITKRFLSETIKRTSLPEESKRNDRFLRMIPGGGGRAGCIASPKVSHLVIWLCTNIIWGKLTTTPTNFLYFIFIFFIVRVS